MRKLVYVLMAAACLTTGAAWTTETASAQNLTIGIGDNNHRNYRDSRSYRNDRWDHRARRSYARDCRMVTVRTQLASGRVIIRKTQRCYR